MNDLFGTEPAATRSKHGKAKTGIPTHGLVPSADDRDHLMVVDLSKPTPMLICHLIDRLKNKRSVETVRDYADNALRKGVQ